MEAENNNSNEDEEEIDPITIAVNAGASLSGQSKIDCKVNCFSKGGFPFRGKCRAIDFLRSLSFEMCSLMCV